MDLKGKTAVITGASRGIGEAIALRLAEAGMNIAILAKSDKPHPKLPGTIHTVAEKVEALGVQALPLKVDIRHEEEVETAMDKVVETFGSIDVLVNNASAIFLAGTLETPMKRYDLMNQVNARGTYLVSQKAIPHMMKADNPHIVTLSPPLNMNPKWFANNTAYTIAKYGMSMCVLGMSAEFAHRGIAVNALWPQTAIATAALAMLGGVVKPENCRKPTIVADAVHEIIKRPSAECTGNFFIDEDLLGSDLSDYAVDPQKELFQDFFID